MGLSFVGIIVVGWSFGGVIGVSKENGVCFSFRSIYKMVRVLKVGECLGDVVFLFLEVLGAAYPKGSKEKADDDTRFYFVVVV